MNPASIATATVNPVETIVIGPGSFVYRPAGEYLRSGRPIDPPVRDVTIRHQLEIAKYQVSEADYFRCVEDAACKAPDNGRSSSGLLPATGVSYLDATAYAAWFSGQTGEKWRLPTDEEWAYAASERFVDDALNLPDESAGPAARLLARYRAESSRERLDPQPRPRGHFGANSRGLFDIAGNVWEWTTGCYSNSSLSADGTVAGTSENCGVRIVGGRHRGYMSTFIRDGKSGGCAAGMAPDNLGFRLVRGG